MKQRYRGGGAKYALPRKVCGVKRPKSTKLSRQTRGLLIAALIAWEKRQECFFDPQLSAWAIMKARRLVNGHRHRA
jgi:hypothetical protein